MFKSFQNTSRTNGFNGFPALNFQMNNEAYGFSGCTFWLDAAYGTNTQTNLAAVSSWQPRIGGTGNTFIQNTAGNQPRYILSNASYNNFPTIEFYDSARGMECQDSIGSINNTIAFVANYNTLNGLWNTLLSYDATQTAQNIIILGGGRSAAFTGIGIANQVEGIDMVTTIETSNTHIVVLNKNRIIVDGVDQVSGNVGVNNIFRRLGRWLGNSYSLLGNVAEIMIYNNLMSSADCVRLSNNINSKYAIY